MAQEALNNISKHASADRVAVKLLRTGEGIMLSLRDNGLGFDPKAGIRPTAVGLAGIRERVSAMGGRLRVDSAPSRGTELTAVVPEPMDESEAELPERGETT